MSRQLPPLTWFRAFEASARHLSFTLAAHELNVTQPAISQHVRALEGKLGKVLFRRLPRGLALTDAGRLLLPYTSAAIDGLIQAADLFLPDLRREVITVSCTTSFAQLWLAPRFLEFQAAYPNVAVQLVSTLWPDDYLVNRTDIEVRFGRISQVRKPARLLMQIDLAPACAPSLLGQAVVLEDLWELPLIETVGAMYGWKRWAKRAGLSSPPAAACSVDSLIMAQSFAEAGIGVALLSPQLCTTSLGARRLVLIGDSRPSAEDCYYFTVNEQAASQPSVCAFADWLGRQAAGF